VNELSRGIDVNAARAVGLLVGVAADAVLAGPRRRPLAAGRLGGVLAGDRRVTNGRHAGLVIGGAVLLGAAAERLGRRNPLLQAAGTAAATWAVLGGASVAAEGAAMARALDAGDLAEARQRLPRLTDRDPSTLDGPGLARATVESVAEGTAEAVVGPLLWGAVAGVPGLLGYGAVNALQAHPPDRHDGRFGWAAARLDDAANLVPSRAAAVLTTVCAPVVGGSAPGAWEVWRRDRALHPSPNVGQVEAAFAGALEIRLGGRAVYPYGIAERPVLGHGRTPDAGDVTRGVELSRVVTAAAAVGSAALAALIGARRRRRARNDRRRR
jgi:adenosylcobinamide-phosphate synthase